ncbi:MAG: tandem-95 repeat protein, partial [Saprospiraceae bacterium]|nr:tandem-95 repeat protein [Saprospiraceae bacterium]
DSFRYQICNNSGECQQTTAVIKVHAVNDAPIARDDADTLIEDSWMYLEVMSNDSDDMDSVPFEIESLEIVQMPGQGQLEMEGGNIIYRPGSNYFGNDYFRYVICDESLCDTAIARIHIKAVNDAPRVRNDRYETFTNLLLIMDVSENDDDSLDLALPDFSSLSTTGLQQPQHGFIYLDQEVNLIVYVPDDDFTGIDSFQYRLCDFGPEPILCDTAMVMINVVSEGSNRLVTQKERIVLAPDRYSSPSKGSFSSFEILSRVLPGLEKHYPATKIDLQTTSGPSGNRKNFPAPNK